jgi:hypothetical protein
MSIDWREMKNEQKIRGRMIITEKRTNSFPCRRDLNLKRIETLFHTPVKKANNKAGLFQKLKFWNSLKQFTIYCRRPMKKHT